MQRITLMALLVLLGLTPSVSGQDKQETQEEKRRRQRIDRRVRTLRTRLKLSQAQIEQVRKILLGTQASTDALKQAEQQKIGLLLTPNQQEKQQAYQKAQQARRERQASYRKNWIARYMGLDLSKLLKALELTSEQEQKLRATIDEANKLGMEKYNALTKGGSSGKGRRRNRWSDPDYVKKWRELLDTGKARARKKIATMLNEQQKRAFEAINKKTDERTRKSRERQASWRNRSKRNSDARKARTPEGRLQARLAAALKALELPDEEAAVLGPLIEQLMRYQRSSARQLKTLRDQLSKLAGGKGDEAALRKKIEALRKSQTESARKLASLRAGLRELLTFDQEAKLIGLDILD